MYGDQIRGAYDAWRKLGRGWNLGISWKYTRLLQLLRRSVDAVTAVSTVLQRRYGGTLLRHGPDEDRFDPNRNFGSKSQLRKKWGLPEKKKLAVFIGTPCSHKELDTLADALSRPSLEEWAFVLVGPHENEFVTPLREKVPERSYFLGPQKYDYAPEFLHLADAIPIPKKEPPSQKRRSPQNCWMRWRWPVRLWHLPSAICPTFSGTESEDGSSSPGIRGRWLEPFRKLPNARRQHVRECREHAVGTNRTRARPRLWRRSGAFLRTQRKLGARQTGLLHSEAESGQKSSGYLLAGVF